MSTFDAPQPVVLPATQYSANELRVHKLVTSRKPIELPLPDAATIQLAKEIGELREQIEAKDVHIKKLRDSLKWAMAGNGEPRLIKGQNEKYYKNWHSAREVLEATK
jgi:hypothetical protein